MSDISQTNGCSQSTSAEPMRESVISFWVACAGLAVIAHVISTGVYFFIPYYDSWIIDLSFSFYTQAASYPQATWDTLLSLRLLAGASVTQSVVIVCVIPILYWRGHLALRFSLSIVIAVTVLNVSGDSNIYDKFKANWNEVGMIAACWTVLPLLLIWTPIQTRQQRLIVASGVLLLTFCVSMLHMYQAPPNIFFVNWMALYAAAFSFALLRRNWGHVAMLEKGTNLLQIETTSTRTLLELMLVTGLACRAASNWSISEEVNATFAIISAAMLGVMMAMVSIESIRIVLESTTFRFLRLLGLWSLTAGLFSANTLVVVLLERSRWGQINSIFWESLLYWPQLYVILFGSMIGSFAFLLLALGVGCWLRWCGWRVEHARVAEVVTTQSFSDLD